MNFKFQCVDSPMVITCFGKIKSRAVGTDDISLNMLSIVMPHLIDHVTFILNTAITSSIFPDAWKHAIVLPVPKIADPTALSHLRPISILPALSKLLEMVMAKQITEYVLQNNVIPSSQSGFRATYSTTTALWNVCDDILRNTDEGKVTCLLLLDYSKAFDTLDHEILCHKLRYLGFGDDALCLVSNYLSLGLSG